jgi:hypothetical protein
LLMCDKFMHVGILCHIVSLNTLVILARYIVAFFDLI